MRPGMTAWQEAHLAAEPGSNPAHPVKAQGTSIFGRRFSARLGVPRSGRNATTENKMNPGRIAIAATAFACTALLGVSLSVDSVQAQTREGHMASSKQMASRHVAAAPRGHMRRHVARGYARGYGPNPLEAGADVAAGAIGTAGAIAAAPFGAGPYAAAPGWNEGYYASSTWGDFDCRPGYAGCQPYSSKDWSKR
jgi:hypothetical protein